MDWQPCFIRSSPISNGLVDFKICKNIFATEPEDSRERGLKVMYINEVGEITPHLLGVWKANPFNLLLTMIKTVYRRIRKRFYRKYASCLRRRPSRVNTLKLAILHVLTNDPSVLRRGFFAKKLHAYNYWVYKNKLSESARFIFDQASLRAVASWLQFRGAKAPRVKLNDKTLKALHSYRTRPLEVGAVLMYNRKFLNEQWLPMFGMPRQVPYGWIASLRGAQTSTLF
jgi:hypothetical protein